MKMKLVLMVLLLQMLSSVHCSEQIDQNQNVLQKNHERELHQIKRDYKNNWYLLAGVGTVNCFLSLASSSMQAYQDCDDVSERKCTRSMNMLAQQVCMSVTFLAALHCIKPEDQK